MKRKLLILAVILVLCAGMAIPAQAANVFVFTEKSVTLFEGETAETALRREGSYDGEGEITYKSAKPDVATVAEDGTITAVSRGKTEVTASLVRNGKAVVRARVAVTVLRAVTKVTLNITKLNVYEPDDPLVAPLLKENTAEAGEAEETANQVLLLPAGATVALSATCTPEDASSRKVTFTSTDAGVAKIAGTSLRAMQRGECDLVIASAQNPEVTETFRVLVVQPVKKIQIDAGDKKVAAGSTLQLTAACAPDNASIRKVTWSSKNPTVATVDEDGVVTGVKKGTASIIATAADGSRTTATVSLTVTQPVSSIVLSQEEVSVTAGRTAQVRVKVLPADASDRSVLWTSSDESVATVRNGQVTGRKAGTCTITCTSKSNPEVSATATVTVSQLVTKIECANGADELVLRTGESVQLRWEVLPDDATNKELTFKSQHPRVATVDENGVVTAVGRGVASIVATARDGSRKQRAVKITVIQPVTGISLQQDLYYVQKGRRVNVVAEIEPANANNKEVTWITDDESIATARSNGTYTGSVTGVSIGETTVYGTTVDGGYTASARIRVGNFNEAVMVEELKVVNGTDIRITMRNMSRDITLENIHFKVELLDLNANPLVCNTDGESNFFEGDYTYELEPLERTDRNAFRFRNAEIGDKIGGVILTVLSWRDSDGVTWKIPENDRLSAEWYQFLLQNTPAPSTDEEGVG